jgi:vancomycin resistance protein YoaR
MEYTIYLINRKAVKIIERFSHSILVEYIKTGVQASVSPDCIRRKKVNYTLK